MSYEGYEQILCENDHYHERDCYWYYGGRDGFSCDSLINGKACGARIKTINSVDDTNCDSYGYRKIIEIEPERIETCNLGQAHTVHHARHRLSNTRYYAETSADGPTVWHPYCEDSSINDGNKEVE